jgi:hypothetical protein
MSNFLSYFMARTSYIGWDDEDICFVLDQHAKLDFYSASYLKQQSADRHDAPLELFIPIPSQLFLTFTP